VKASEGVLYTLEVFFICHQDSFPKYFKHVKKRERNQVKTLCANRSYRRNTFIFISVANGCGGAT
jgi:hypothetical protein